MDNLEVLVELVHQKHLIQLNLIKMYFLRVSEKSSLLQIELSKKVLAFPCLWPVLSLSIHSLQEQTKTVRRKIASEFQRLHQFLQQQEQLLLAQLGELEKEVVKTQTENVTILSKEISYLSDLISEMEGKYQQPVDEFLQVRAVKYFGDGSWEP